MSGLIWVRTVWHYDGILKEFLEKVNFEKNQQTAKHSEKFPSMQSSIIDAPMPLWFHTHSSVRDVGEIIFLEEKVISTSLVLRNNDLPHQALKMAGSGHGLLRLRKYEESCPLKWLIRIQKSHLAENEHRVTYKNSLNKWSFEKHRCQKGLLDTYTRW